jgi:hypothetical protein
LIVVSSDYSFDELYSHFWTMHKVMMKLCLCLLSQRETYWLGAQR